MNGIFLIKLCNQQVKQAPTQAQLIFNLLKMAKNEQKWPKTVQQMAEKWPNRKRKYAKHTHILLYMK